MTDRGCSALASGRQQVPEKNIKHKSDRIRTAF